MPDILLIDDDDDIRDVLTFALKAAGFSVRQAANGNIGLAEHRKKPADLIITDLLMPEREGIETIRELRKSDRDVPVIVITGGGPMPPDALIDLAGTLGATTGFAKPFSVKELIEAVRGLLDDAGPEAAAVPA